jgi:hypothetical protein
MPISLTTKEIGYLKQLEAAGNRGRTISVPTSRAGLLRLIDAGYVTDRAGSRVIWGRLPPDFAILAGSGPLNPGAMLSSRHAA